MFGIFPYYKYDPEKGLRRTKAIFFFFESILIKSMMFHRFRTTIILCHIKRFEMSIRNIRNIRLLVAKQQTHKLNCATK